MKPVSDRTQQLHQALFEQLGAPDIPPELVSDDFLGGIYQHATEAAAAELAPALEGLTPLVAPEDACWQQVDECDLSAEVEAVLPGPGSSAGAPGWMWSRIREDLRGETRRLRRRSARVRWMQYAAAAVVIVSLAFGTTFLLSDGTNDRPEIVFKRDLGLGSPSDSLFGRHF